jgi:NTE family protein
MAKKTFHHDEIERDCGCPHTGSSYAPGAKVINLAIQGGGAHGAYAWGVIDRLLEDGRIQVEGLCGTSAGSMNAVVFAYGNMIGGRGGARETLYNFWKKISQAGALYSPLKQTPWEYINSHANQSWNQDGSLAYQVFDLLTRTFSPYQFNPFNFNPLRQVVEETVDFGKLKRCQSTKLFLSTTNVRTGRVRVFRTEEITADVVMASACLPQLFQAVQIGEDHYWDGGYMGNPALFPLFYHADSRDVLVIHINPIERDEVPASSADILNRLNEITFNSSLLKEMRAIAFVNKLIQKDWIKEEHKHKLKDVIMHSIRADGVLCDLSVASKFNTDWHFLLYLRDLGRDMAGQWLDANFESIGKVSTVDLRAEFLDMGVPHSGIIQHI